MSWTVRKGRWVSRRWLDFVREQPCVVSGLEGETIQAAHFRYPGCGMGVKPSDFMTYPLAAGVHDMFHRMGQPAHETQLNWVKATIRRAGALGLWEGEWPMDTDGRPITQIVDIWLWLWVDGDVREA